MFVKLMCSKLLNKLVMNENIDLTKILKDCPKGTKFYSSIYGELIYSHTYVSPSATKFVFILPNSNSMFDNTPMKIEYYWNGKYIINMGECTLFPSKGQQDWNKFIAPWYKKERFDPKTLKPFDRILGRLSEHCKWTCGFFSYADDNNFKDTVNCMDHYITNVIPYNEETKHLVGTKEEAPEYYRYWEN